MLFSCLLRQSCWPWAVLRPSNRTQQLHEVSYVSYVSLGLVIYGHFPIQRTTWLDLVSAQGWQIAMICGSFYRSPRLGSRSNFKFGLGGPDKRGPKNIVHTSPNAGIQHVCTLNKAHMSFLYSCFGTEPRSVGHEDGHPEKKTSVGREVFGEVKHRGCHCSGYGQLQWTSASSSSPQHVWSAGSAY
jgi:hypothetical protein